MSNNTSLEEIQREDHLLHHHRHHLEGKLHDHQDVCPIVAYICNIDVDQYEV